MCKTRKERSCYLSPNFNSWRGDVSFLLQNAIVCSVHSCTLSVKWLSQKHICEQVLLWPTSFAINTLMLSPLYPLQHCKENIGRYVHWMTLWQLRNCIQIIPMRLQVIVITYCYIYLPWKAIVWMQYTVRSSFSRVVISLLLLTNASSILRISSWNDARIVRNWYCFVFENLFVIMKSGFYIHESTFTMETSGAGKMTVSDAVHIVFVRSSYLTCILRDLLLVPAILTYYCIRRLATAFLLEPSVTPKWLELLLHTSEVPGT